MKLIFIITVILSMSLTTLNAQWREVDSPTSKEITDIHFVDSENGFMSCELGTVLKTTNGGLDWQAFNTGIPASFRSIFGIDKDTVYTASISLYKSTNSCVSWADFGGLGSWGSTIFDIHFLSSKTGFIIKSGKLYKTNDYGLNWYKVYDNVYSNGNIIFTSQDTGYVVGGETIICDPGSCNFPFNRGAIIKTTDRGESWQKLIFFNDTLNIISASFIDNNFGYCFSSNNSIQKTEDGGLTWISINTGITGNISGGLFINKDIGFIITIGQIYITINGGINWDLEYTVSDGGLFKLNRSNRMVVAGGTKGLICVRSLDNLNLFTGDMLWSTMQGIDCSFDDFDYRSYYTKAFNDTIIDEILYKRIMNSTDVLMNEWYDVGFIREDGQQVFYRKINSDTECLLYDFSCSVGDVLNLDCSCIYESKFKVDSIKYLPVMGHTRKHIYLSYPENSSTECWIEGIGSVSGILNGGGAGNCMTDFHERLLCCSKNDEIIYKDPDFDTCYLPTESNMADGYSEKNSLLMIFPNPTNNEITIRTASNNRIQYVELVSLKGKSVLKQAEIDKTECQLHTGYLPKGTYILKVKTNHKLESNRIIIL